MALVNGRAVVPTPGTAVQFGANSVATRTIVITALSTNTNPVSVGGAGVVAAAGARTGMGILPNSDPLVLEYEHGFTDIKELWVDAVTAGEGVSFTYSAL